MTSLRSAGVAGASTAVAGVATKLVHLPTVVVIAEVAAATILYVVQMLLQHRAKQSVAERRAKTVDDTVPKDGSPEQLREWRELVKAIGED